MRIAVINWSSRKVGGVETYLSALIPELELAGHEVAFWCEADEPANRDRIELSPRFPMWCVAELGAEKALAALSDWQPDVIYTHKLMSPELEAETLKIAPSVFFAHDYYGTCISGTKTHKFPIARPCDRRFGPMCLVHYFPRRCGGLSPVTMVKLYRLQSKRLALLHRYDAIVTHSDHMLKELINHGLSPRSAYSFPYYVEGGVANLPPVESNDLSAPEAPESDGGEEEYGSVEARPHVQLVFSGRMEFLKGGHVLLEALPEVQRALGKTVRVIFAGEGRKRKDLERRAARLQQRNAGIEIEFVGWVDRARMDLILDESDLMVVPSLWPEPFGLVGPEAGLRGLPVAAFAVGGVPDWLIDGVNGHLAPGDPPTAKGLAEAIVRCLANMDAYANLRRGAIRLAGQFSIRTHLRILMSVFTKVASNDRVQISEPVAQDLVEVAVKQR